ncbi:MAG: membrane protein insertase YidC, partial [Pseudomonadota bacterium]
GATTTSKAPAAVTPPGDVSSAPTGLGQSVPAGVVGPSRTRAAALAASERVAIKTPAIEGSINLTGAQIDDVVLPKYRTTTADDAPPITVFSPVGAPDTYFAEHGWASTTGSIVDSKTKWTQTSTGALTPSNPLVLRYEGANGLVFTRTITVDDNYMFSIRQDVENTGTTAQSLFPYAFISRHGEPEGDNIFILHEGLLGVFQEDGLVEVDYDDAIEAKRTAYEGTGGWVGITDKYFSAALVPDQTRKFKAEIVGSAVGGTNYYQANYALGSMTIAPGGKASVTGNVFAGAKRADILDTYETKLSIDRFTLMVDWGYFWFITKPLYWLLKYIYDVIGNYGVAILLVTVLIKILFFPLANKSYVSMGRMKKLQPEMERIKERFGDDRARQQKAMMELYQKEKINPMAGCLPILLQIPVFFALYKVLYVSIEMRHAPFFGWVQDLSAPDPTSIFNLFGLLPYAVPAFLLIGVWPLLMGISMWVQMKLNPAPTDPIQQTIFTWMPVFFTFLLASFPAGLVIYWTWNNILSVAQQWIIMSREGVKVELFDNIRKSLAWMQRGKPTGDA